MTSLKKDIAQLMQANWQGAANADSAASYTQTIQKDLDVLAKALNGGNSADSKQALATLKKDPSGMKGAAAHRPHQHHHGKASASPAGGAATSSVQPQKATDTDITNSAGRADNDSGAIDVKA